MPDYVRIRFFDASGEMLHVFKVQRGDLSWVEFRQKINALCLNVGMSWAWSFA